MTEGIPSITLIQCPEKLNYSKCALSYWLIALLHNHSHAFTCEGMGMQFCLVMTYLYSIVDTSHVRLACMVVFVPAQLIQMEVASRPTLFDNCCTWCVGPGVSKEQSIPSQ